MSLSLVKRRMSDQSLQWLFAILLGLLLGGYILIVLRLPAKWFPLLIAAAIFPFALLVIGNLRKTLLALILLDIPIQLDIAVKAHWALNSTGVINGYIISITTVCLVILYTQWMIELIVNKDAIKTRFRRPNLYLSLYVTVCCATLITTDLQILASFKLFLILQIFLFYLYVINQIRDNDALLFTVVMLLVGLLLESLIIIFIQITGQDFNIAGIMGNIYAQSAAPGSISRIGGTLVSANSAGSYLGLLLVPAFSLLLANVKSSYKWLALIAFVCGVVALIQTGSRGAWLATAISFFIFGIGGFRKRWLNIKVVLISTVIAVVVAVFFYSPVCERIYGYDAGSADSRWSQNEVAFRIIKDHPLLGVGLNNYPVVQRQYLKPDPNNTVFRWVVHNKYLLVWSETGIFGLLFFFMFLLSTIHQGITIFHTNDSYFAPLAFAFTAAIAGQMVHMFFDVFQGRSQVQLLWLISGLLMVMYYLVQEKKRRKCDIYTQS